MEIKPVNPALPNSYERHCHEAGVPAFCLPLRNADSGLAGRLSEPLLERAIGVIYRPEAELASHYFQAVLPRQFDEYIWLDRTTAITPFDTRVLEAMPDTYPFGL
jgi:protein-L-isoaspartate(D-aspartate) O-methyltransferase